MVDRGDHDARTVGVEQSDRKRLVAGHLVVGVVADERPVCHRPIEAPLGSGEPLVKAPTDILDIVAQRLKALVDRRRVRDEIGVATLTEDAPLGGAQAAQRKRECGSGSDRDHADAGCGDRDCLRG